MRVLVALVAALALMGAAQAWQASPELPHHADLAERAAQRLPADQAALVRANLDAFRRGALDPDGVTNPHADVHTFYHTYEPDDEDGGGLYQVKSSLHDAVVAMREGMSGEEVAYRLGHLTHFVTDLAVPYHTADGLYDHEQHGPFETEAHRHQHRELVPTRSPQEVTDVHAYMTDVAARSAAMGDRLVQAWSDADGAWSQEIDAIARELEQLSIDAAADMMATAFAMADPARPTPTFDEPRPIPIEPEDVGLSLQEQWRNNPTVVIGAGVVLAALGVAILVALSRRRERHGRRPL